MATTQSGKSKIDSDFRVVRALYNFSEGKKRREKGNSRVMLLHHHKLMSHV